MKSIDELLATNEPVSGEKIYYVHRDALIPDPNQDRDDWDSPETIANIESIRKSSNIKLADGKRYGIRTPLWVKPVDDDDKYMIIDGECRWRSTEGAEGEEALLPIIIRTGDSKELRLDHTSSNGARKGLTLFQTANSIKRDMEEFGLSTEEIIAVHGLTSKSQLSKYTAVHKLNDRQLALVKAGHFGDINLIFDLRKLDDEALGKLEKRLKKGESAGQAMKAIAGKPEPKAKPEEPAPADGAANKISLTLPAAEAKALAMLLDVEAELSLKELKAALQAKISLLAADTEQTPQKAEA